MHEFSKVECRWLIVEARSPAATFSTAAASSPTWRPAWAGSRWGAARRGWASGGGWSHGDRRATLPSLGPLAPRPPHFPAKAKRVLHIFCTGAVSHLDTWDYKPALWKRDGQPMPGVEKLITFQGENGNLARSPWTFRQRGQTGK